MPHILLSSLPAHDPLSPPPVMLIYTGSVTSKPFSLARKNLTIWSAALSTVPFGSNPGVTPYVFSYEDTKSSSISIISWDTSAGSIVSSRSSLSVSTRTPIPAAAAAISIPAPYSERDWASISFLVSSSF